jgi:ABC-type transport system involved in cytochrome c biogenesis permease subunit
VLNLTKEKIMLRSYKRAGNIALGIAVVCFAATVVLGRNSTGGNAFGPGGAPPALMHITVLSFAVMFYTYAKAKGYPGWLGVLLAFLSVVGLIVLLRLIDRHPQSEVFSSKETAVKAWVTYVFIAVGLGALAYVMFFITSNK